MLHGSCFTSHVHKVRQLSVLTFAFCTPRVLSHHVSASQCVRRCNEMELIPNNGMSVDCFLYARCSSLDEVGGV